MTRNFTDSSLTPGMLAVLNGPEAIKAYASAGGKFDDTQNKDGWTAGMFAISHGAEYIGAYAAAGGKFNPEIKTKKGEDAGMIAAIFGPDRIEAFSKAGGKFTDNQNNFDGYTAAMTVVCLWGNLGGIEAFVKAGGIFTDQKNNHGETVDVIARNKGVDKIFKNALATQEPFRKTIREKIEKALRL